ncbi:hypothetical protein [Mesorhizobium sp. B2-8-5]|uniref:hypothetical protein n=1 Tax=Mesorhizobium sp. B2-8-5 TaxID=2589903 RepID=UPI00112E6EB1|nr:hypothetical protein [Mesorhizobium sp. B2-8-5]UCI24634.1 hypothetical protein FJ430_24030 [Mesorhizobium sp. B2-8-5]
MRHLARKQRSFSKIDLPYIALNFLIDKAFQNNTSEDGVAIESQPAEGNEPADKALDLGRERATADDDPIWNENHLPLDEFVQRLVSETEIGEAQALDLIYLVGLNWNSLIREAKAIASQS